MKSNKPAFAAIAVVLALWASNAQALLLDRFEKLNFSLTAAQQGLENSETSSNVFVSTIKTSKITNKDLLSFLATALNTNWPAGAQLALGEIEVTSGPGFGPPPIIWDIFVVDKTGTNPVFDVSTGINVGDTNVAYFSFDSDLTVVRSKMEGKGEIIVPTNENAPFGPGIGIGSSGGSISSSGSNFGKIFFHLFNEQNGITNTDLYFDGLNVIEFHSNTTVTTNKITGYGTTSEQAPVTGDGTFNDKWTVIKGNVTSLGKWEEYGLIARPIIPTNWPPPIQFTNTIPFTNWPPIRFTNSIPFTNIIIIPTNRPPPILFTNIIIPFTNTIPFTNIFTITNRPLGFYPTTNSPPPIIILNP